MTPKLLSEWNGQPHYIYEFITILETMMEMKIVELKLSQIRCAEDPHVEKSLTVKEVRFQHACQNIMLLSIMLKTEKRRGFAGEISSFVLSV